MHLRSKGLRWRLYFLILGVAKAIHFSATSTTQSFVVKVVEMCNSFCKSESRKPVIFEVEPKLEATQKMCPRGVYYSPRAITISPPLS
jgi:hypothetical protein